ncbi:MAG: hypothetical protein Ct9H300mP4_06150 [Gammaproteobacteria bacterium]|nr:MAG: hypothetical protein Ct9H300mP4_06150 [Gammaproteobacteria bacterium]
MSNPAATRIPDAHFFWEARYNGTQVIAISPDFTPTAMHSSLWLKPKPGTDSALAMAMVEVILRKIYIKRPISRNKGFTLARENRQQRVFTQGASLTLWSFGSCRQCLLYVG